MTSRFRSQILQEAHSQTGAIVDEMKSYSIQPVENDGLNLYSNTRINPDVSPPFTSSQDITIRLTSNNFDVCEFGNSYLHLKLRLRLRFQNAPKVEGSDQFADMLKKNQFVFLGLKASSHIIRSYSFKFNDVPIPSTMQSSALYESFLYSTLMSKQERENKKYVFSPYEEVVSLDNSTCGVFIPVGELVDGSYQMLDLIIPYNNLLALQGWQEFPNRIFGELKLVCNTTAEGFVYAEVSPMTSIKKGILSGKIDKATPHISDVLSAVDSTFEFNRCFEQVSVPSSAQFITGWDSENNKLKFASSAEFTPFIDELMVVEAWTDVKGYRASDAALSELQRHFSSEPFVVCAQKMESYSFPQGPDYSGLRCAMNVRFNRATDAVVLFPKDSRHRTIFTNIAYDKLQLQIGNQRYPEQLLSTDSPQFFEQQIQASDFDSMFSASEEFEHSMTDIMTDGERYLKPTTDNTSFIVLYEFERSGGSAANSTWFDGISGVEKVEISGSPIYPNFDCYFNGINTPAPILCTCCESWWLFRIVGGKVNCQYCAAHEFKEAYDSPDVEAV